jgi:hypothetical protein
MVIAADGNGQAAGDRNRCGTMKKQMSLSKQPSQVDKKGRCVSFRPFFFIGLYPMGWLVSPAGQVLALSGCAQARHPHCAVLLGPTLALFAYVAYWRPHAL